MANALSSQHRSELILRSQIKSAYGSLRISSRGRQHTRLLHRDLKTQVEIYPTAGQAEGAGSESQSVAVERCVAVGSLLTGLL
mmetsp:Transcript_31927/g.82691  ORF Transcript_31927/g.82691 Transcript_31927/m.82691 type:complete len:83 (-) Transcript_31927:725-973(-)